jgi:hypothetical protein
MCGTALTTGGAFCPICGNRVSLPVSPPVSPNVQAPAYWGPSPTQPLPVRKSHTGLIVGIVLIVVVIVAISAVGGSYAYASGAVASLQPTCASTSDSVNWIGLTISILTTSFTPSTVLGEIQVEYGIHNPSSITVNSNWMMQISWAGSSVSDQQAFTVPAGTTQFVTFHLPITVTTAIKIVTASLTASNTSILVSLTRDDSAYGFHFTNQFTSQSNTSTSSSSSASNSTSTLPSC